MSTANSLPSASRGMDSSSSSLPSLAACSVPLPASGFGLGLCLGVELVLVSLLPSASFFPSASVAAWLAASFLASCLAFSAASSSFAACRYQPHCFVHKDVGKAASAVSAMNMKASISASSYLACPVHRAEKPPDNVENRGVIFWAENSMHILRDVVW